MKRMINWNASSCKLAGIALITLLLAATAALGADRPRKTSILLRPKRNESVARNYEVVGRMFTAGQPLVLIRPEVEEVEWWLQPVGSVNEKGYFKAKVCFGSDQSKSGDRFQVIIVTLRSAEEAQMFKGKEFITELPESLLVSTPISVTLDKSGAVTEPAEDDPEIENMADVSDEVLLEPVGNSQVDTETEITGKVPDGSWPIVLVRSEDANDSWWVQGPVTMAGDNAFSAIGHFGNEKTTSGMKFHVLVLLLPSEQAAGQFEPGAQVTDIPANLPRSKEIVVVLKRDSATNERSAKP